MIEKARAAGKIMADVLLPGETQARHSGELTFIDNAVDRSTGTIVARATISNTDREPASRPVRSHSAGASGRSRMRLSRCPRRPWDPVSLANTSMSSEKETRADQRLVSTGASHDAVS